MKTLITMLSALIFHIPICEGNYLETALVSLLPQSCTLILWKMAPNSTKALNENLEHSSTVTRGIVVLEDNSVDLRTVAGESVCLTGISNVGEGTTIQAMLLPTFNRQIVLLSKNSTSPVPPVIDKRHHPLMVLVKHNSAIHQHVRCYKEHGTTQVNYFHLKSHQWTVTPSGDRIYAEGACNKGNHPLHGKVLVASAYSIPPFMYIDENNVILDGIAIRFLNTLAGYFNFRYNTTMPGLYWKVEPDGSISGSIGEVIDGVADFSIEMPQRVASSFGTTTNTAYFAEISFIEPRPKSVPKLWNISYALDGFTWLLFFILYISVSLSLFSLIHVTSNKWRQNSVSSKLGYSFETAYELIFREHHRKGKDFTRQWKIIHMLWIVACMFVTMAFMGTLKSTFVRQDYEKRTETLNQMLEKDTKIHAAIEHFEYLKSVSMFSVISKRIADQIKKTNGVYNIAWDDSFNQVADDLLTNGGAVMYAKFPYKVVRGSWIKNGQDFPFVVIPERYTNVFLAMLFQKFDPRAAYFNTSIQRLYDCGLIDYFYAMTIPYEDIILEEPVMEEALILEYFFVPFLLLGAGLIIAFIFFIYETLKTSSKRNLGTLTLDFNF